MAATLNGSTDVEKFADLCNRTYKEQAIWILNGFWKALESQAENFWKFVELHAELDLDKGKEGSALDEFNAHRFLEKIDETKTVKEMRDTLEQTMGVRRMKMIPLIHYLMFKHSLTLKDTVHASQGSDPEELEEAQRLFDLAMEALRKCQEAEAPFKKAQEELQTALAELKAQEDAYARKTEELKQRSESGGVVQRNKAKAELEIHLAEDPLPLRRAKINTEAAERKADKARAPFREATEDAEAKFQAAQDHIEQVKKKGGVAHGAIWWMERELAEARKYLPSSKQ